MANSNRFTGVFILAVVFLSVFGIGLAGIGVPQAGSQQVSVNKTFVSGSQQYLQTQVTRLFRLEERYKSARSNAEKFAVRGDILEVASKVDDRKIPGDLNQFISDLREQY